MSAWIVDEAHIDVLLDCAAQYGAGSKISATPTTTGRMLLAENIRSVGFRYKDSADTHNLWPNLPGRVPNPDPDAYLYRPTGRQFTPGEAFKALGCFEYQSCETPDWAETEAYSFCESLRDAIIGSLYPDGGPWGYTDEDLGRPVRAVCETHGAQYMAHHKDGSATCGACYMQRGVELGVIAGE